MNRGLVNLEKLRDNFDKADFKYGKSSYCFIIGDKIVKIYAKKDGEDFIPKNIYDFSKFIADTIVFPNEYIYENGIIVGEISDYINSMPIVKSFNDEAKIDKIIDGFELVIQDLATYKDIDMQDLCSANILYSNENGFHIIDTTEWIMKLNSLKKNIFRFNSSLVSEIIDYAEIPIKYSKYYNRIDDTFLNNMAKYGDVGKRLKDNMDKLMYGEYYFLELIFAYMDLYQKHFGREMKTLKDMDEMTKVLKKG